MNFKKLYIKRSLKYILPSIALCILVVAFFCIDNNFHAHQIKTSFFLNQARHLTYKDNTHKGQDFVIRSQKCIELSKKQLVFEALKTELLETSSNKIALRAEHGIFNKENKSLILSGNVHVKHSNGLELSTAAITIDFDNKTAEGNTPILAKRDNITIESNQINITANGEKIIFSNQPQMTFSLS